VADRHLRGLDFFGQEHDWTPISGTVHVTAHQAVELGRFLADIGQTGAADHAAQVKAYLSALRKEVSQ